MKNNSTFNIRSLWLLLGVQPLLRKVFRSKYSSFGGVVLVLHHLWGRCALEATYNLICVAGHIQCWVCIVVILLLRPPILLGIKLVFDLREGRTWRGT